MIYERIRLNNTICLNQYNLNIFLTNLNYLLSKILYLKASYNKSISNACHNKSLRLGIGTYWNLSTIFL